MFLLLLSLLILFTFKSIYMSVFRNTVPYSEGQITFNLLSTEPVPRPAHNKLYQTPDLQEFLQASLVRITLMGHYYVNHFRHGYFGLSELIVGGR